MPKLIRLYIVSVAIGFALAALFVAMLVWFDIANLRHLVLGQPMGWLAAIMLTVFHGIVFAGAQFAIAIMRLAEDDDEPRGGRRAPVATREPARVMATADAPAKRGLPRR